MKKYARYILTGIILVGLILYSKHSIKEQRRKDAIAAIDNAISSLEENPSQFTANLTFNCSMTGAKFTGQTVIAPNIESNKGSATGVHINPDFSNISCNNESNVEYAKGQINKDVEKKSQEAIKLLQELKINLGTENKLKINSLLGQMNDTYLPQIAINVLSTIITKAFGL
jgi:hypothetical protein